MQMSKSLTLVLCAGIITLTGCAKLKSRDQLNQGVKAYTNNKYPDAVRHFKEAVELDPSNQNAQLFLATSYMVQWIPGADSPDNQKNYNMARQEFQKVLDKDPKNSLALASMASLAFQSASSGTPEQKMAALEEARRWNNRRIEVDPKDSEAYYYLGVINWAEVHPAIATARVEAHMKPDDPGPLKDDSVKQDKSVKKGKHAKDESANEESVKEDLKAKYWGKIQDGLDNLKKCLSIDKENEDAMSYYNLLLRERAVLQDSPEAAKADVAQAEDWSNKALDMKRIKASRPAKNTAAS